MPDRGGLSSPGVLLHVGNRLGDEVVGGGLELFCERCLETQLELDGERGAKRERLERRDEAALGEHRGVQAACELADLLETGGKLIDRLLEQLASLGRIPQPTEVEQDGG